MKLYSLYDAKAAIYTPPFLAKNDELAKRTIIQSVRALDVNCSLVQYPEDFTLFSIGEWDEDTANIEQHGQLSLGTVLQLISVENARSKPVLQEEDNE